MTASTHQAPGFTVVLSRVRALTLGLFALLGLRAGYVQLHRTAEAQRRLITTIAPKHWHPQPRGTLFDRRGTVLAQDLPACNVRVEPWRFTLPLDSISALALTTESQRQLRRALERPRGSSQAPPLVERGVPRADFDTVWRAVPGVFCEASNLRHYTLGPGAFHVLGYLGPQPLQGPWNPPTVGIAGLERVLENTLQAIPSWSRGPTLSSPPTPRQALWSTLLHTWNLSPGDPGRPGRSVRLTLDASLQESLEALFTHAQLPAGAALVLESHTGRVLAAYSKPSVDPVQFSQFLPTDAWQQLLHDPWRPLLDHFAARAQFPGSVYKPFAATAALAHGVLPSETTCNGSLLVGPIRFRCTDTHGPHIDLLQAFRSHCNAPFYAAAPQLTWEQILAADHAWGFGQATPWDPSPETVGVLSLPPGVQDRPGYHLTRLVGHGTLRITPLQLALAWAALANGGTLFPPSIVSAVEQPNGTWQQAPEPEGQAISLPSSALDEVREALRQTERDFPVAGLGALVAEPYIAHEPLASNAWFAGFFPRDTARYTLVILVRHADHAGIAKQLAERLAATLSTLDIP